MLLVYSCPEVLITRNKFPRRPHKIYSAALYGIWDSIFFLQKQVVFCCVATDILLLCDIAPHSTYHPHEARIYNPIVLTITISTTVATILHTRKPKGQAVKTVKGTHVQQSSCRATMGDDERYPPYATPYLPACGRYPVQPAVHMSLRWSYFFYAPRKRVRADEPSIFLLLYL